jgi:hypothetical protein
LERDAGLAERENRRTVAMPSSCVGKCTFLDTGVVGCVCESGVDDDEPRCGVDGADAAREWWWWYKDGTRLCDGKGMLGDEEEDLSDDLSGLPFDRSMGDDDVRVKLGRGEITSALGEGNGEGLGEARGNGTPVCIVGMTRFLLWLSVGLGLGSKANVVAFLIFNLSLSCSLSSSVSSARGTSSSSLLSSSLRWNLGPEGGVGGVGTGPVVERRRGSAARGANAPGPRSSEKEMEEYDRRCPGRPVLGRGGVVWTGSTVGEGVAYGIVEW